MDPARAAAEPAELLTHLAWVQRLARALVRDAAAAEELAQETLRITLSQPAGRVGSGAKLKGWLRGVARRLALDRFRSEQRRTAHEQAFAPREAQPDAFEVVERSARQQRVAQAVMALAEPYRSTVLYRYLDELPTRAVAARMGVGEELVRKRLERGLAQLRERLDAEFGTNTRSWAVALLAWPGVAAVTVKTKLAVAAALVIGGALAWRALDPAGPRTPARSSPPPSAAAAAAEREAPPDGAPVASADRVEEQDAARRASTARATGSAATLLRVRVVAADGSPCRKGRLDGHWNESHSSAQPPPLRSFSVAIDGDVTALALPASCASARITASIAGFPPSPMEWILDLRSDDEARAASGRVERDVTIRLDGGAAATRITGRIVVDDEPRVPRGLGIEVIGPKEGIRREPCEIRIHSVDARYEIADADAWIEKLWVTSDETVPRMVARDDDEFELDLELATERTLALTVIDRTSRRPLPDVDLYVSVNVEVERSLFRSTSRDHSHYVRTGADGVARVAGLPRKGSVEVRRDAAMTEAELPLAGGGTLRMLQPKEALLAIALEKSMPALIERTLAIDATPVARRAFGRLAAGFLAPPAPGDPDCDVFFAIVAEDARPQRRDTRVPHDEEGNWSLDLVAGKQYVVWVERDRQRVSELARFEAGGRDVGPVELAPRAGVDVRLRLVRCPAVGFAILHVEDPGAAANLGTVIPLHGGTVERTLRLSGPTSIEVIYERDRGSETGSRQHRDVDPATGAVVEFDLGATGGRPLEFTLVGATLPADAVLSFVPIDAAGRPDLAAGDSGAFVALAAGRSREPVALAPGRYFFFLMSALRGRVVGVADVASGPSDVPIRIACDVVAHALGADSAGIRIEAVAALEVAQLDERWRRLFEWRVADPREGARPESLLVPRGARVVDLTE